MTLDAASASCCCGNQPRLSCREWSDCHANIEQLTVTISFVQTTTIRAGDGSIWNQGSWEFPNPILQTYSYQISGTLVRTLLYNDVDGYPIYGFRGTLTGSILGGAEYPNPYPPPSLFQQINIPIDPCGPAGAYFPDCGSVDRVDKVGEVSASATLGIDTVITCVQFPDTGEFGARILHSWPSDWDIGPPQQSSSGQVINDLVCPDPSGPNPIITPFDDALGYLRTILPYPGGGNGPSDLSNALVLRGCVRGDWNNPTYSESGISQNGYPYAGAFGYEQFIPPFFVPICEWDIMLNDWTYDLQMDLSVSVA